MCSAPLAERVDALLDFWFAQPRSSWFNADAGFDRECRRLFLADLDAAVQGAWERAGETPRGALGLVLLFDQLPRNMFRGSPRAFATDPQAQATAKHALHRDYGASFRPVARDFFRLPFEHSEQLADQQCSVKLASALPRDEWGRETLEYAQKHLDVIERFGRFPHRNAVLGRSSTPQELAYLAAKDRPYGTCQRA